MAYLKAADVAITVFFSVEMLLELISRGIVFGPRSYFRHWRILDALIVAVSIAGSVMSDSQVRSLRSLRALRALRPLRVVTKYPSLRLVIDAFMQSMLHMGSIITVLIAFM